MVVGHGQGKAGRVGRLITSLNFYLWHSRKRLGVTHTLIIHGSSAARASRWAAITQDPPWQGRPLHQGIPLYTFAGTLFLPLKDCRARQWSRRLLSPLYFSSLLDNARVGVTHSPSSPSLHLATASGQGHPNKKTRSHDKLCK